MNETFGALLATWQAERATDARVRGTMQRIAADETRHAALAWEILGWGITLLSPAERSRVLAALDRALSALEAAPYPAVAAIVRDVAGYPEREHERRLAREFSTFARAEAAFFALPHAPAS